MPYKSRGLKGDDKDLIQNEMLWWFDYVERKDASGVTTQIYRPNVHGNEW